MITTTKTQTIFRVACNPDGIDGFGVANCKEYICHDCRCPIQSNSSEHPWYCQTCLTQRKIKGEFRCGGCGEMIRKDEELNSLLCERCVPQDSWGDEDYFE